MNYWLIKSEAQAYSIDDLKRDKKTSWDGIRNYQSRNYMMRDMAVGDLVLFYHSMSDPTGIYGIAKVASTAHPDETQFNPKDEHFDPKAKREKPTWYCVDMQFVAKFKHPVSLEHIKADAALEGMMVRQRGVRLSVQPVSKKHFEHIRDSLAK